MPEETKSRAAQSAAPEAEGNTARPKWVDKDPFTRDAPARPSHPTPSDKVAVDPLLKQEEDQAQQRTVRTQQGNQTKNPTTRPAAPRVGSPLGSNPTITPATTNAGFLGLPLVWWILICGILIGVLFIAQDLRNRDRYLLVCTPAAAEIHQGRTFPWPFGHVAVGGEAFRPIPLAAESDYCREEIYQSEEDATQGFLDLILNQIHGVLVNPGSSNLTEARRQIQQAMILSRSARLRRQEAEDLLAQLSYQEGRAGLARAENDLRLALSRFQETQKLAGERFEDLDDWISHLEEILRTISPSPALRSPPTLSLPPPQNQSALPPDPPNTPALVAPTRDAGIAPPLISPDAAPPATGGGILM